MQKKLIALAVAGAFVAPAAFAADSNVTIYGVMDASFEIAKNGEAKNQAGAALSGTTVNRVTNNSSRIGFKGTEDLGNGLAAVWQVETGVSLDNGGDAWANRNTFVGLSGKTWGTVILGRHDTPYKLATRNLDVFGDGTADNRNIMGAGATVTAAGAFGGYVGGAFNGRPNNVVAYISPNMNGFSAAVAYVAGAEGATNSGQKKGSAWSAMANYSNGPWYGALAYERHNIGNALAIGLVAATQDTSQHAWKAGVGYKANNLRVGFEYERTSDDLGNRTAGVGCGLLSGSTSNNCFGHNAWNLGGGYTFGNNEVKLQYTKAGDVGDGVANSGAKQWTLGLDHNFSKRTKIYAMYTHLQNDDNASYTLGVANSRVVTAADNGTGTGGATQSAWGFGMRHTF